MECEPAVNVEVVYVAVPLLSVPVPSVVVPSVNVTTPVAVEGATVAVNVTDAAYVDGFGDDVKEILVFARTMKLAPLLATPETVTLT
jgi:hypothetical protein